MNALHRAIFVGSLLASLFGPLAAVAQSPYPPGPPPAVPALPDSARQTTYTISGTTCACSVGFQLYGDSTDVDAWIEVWVNGKQYLSTDGTFGWSLSSATGPFATIPRPITDAVLTFNNAQTGTVVIVGAQRPRRTAEFQEGAGVPARALNQWFNTVVAMLREDWDKISDLSGRGLFFAPGNTVGPMPQPSACANEFLAFDGTGLSPLCRQVVTSGSLSTPGTTTNGDLASWTSSNGTSLGDSGILGSSVASLVGAGLIQSPNVQSTSYTILSTDCNGIVVETGAFQTITLPASLVGFPANCPIRIVNGNASRAQSLSGFPAASAGAGCGSSAKCLYPAQGLMVAIVGGAWTSVIAAGRYAANSPTLHVAASSCSDNNDGLVSSAPLCHVNTCISLFQSNFDAQGTNPTCQLADGSYTEAVSLSGQSGHRGDGIVINGDVATKTNVVFQGTSGNPAFSARDYGILFVNNLEVTCNGAPAVVSTQFSTIDITNVEYGTCTGEQMNEAGDGGHIDFDSGNIIAGNASVFLYAIGPGSQFEVESQTITCTSTWNFSTAFAEATDYAEVLIPAITFSGCGGVTGTRYLIGSTGLINTGGGGASYLPGGSPGSVGTYGVYE